MNVAQVAGTSRPRWSLVRSDVGTPRAATLIVACLTLLGAGLRFWRIGHQGYWYDEGITVALVHQSMGHVLGLLPQSEGTPPLYYCLAWVWARVFGFGEAGLRSLSALVGVFVAPAIYGIAAKLISRRAGLIAAALAACNPFLIWYSQEARSYSLLVLLAALSLLAFAHLLVPRPPRRMLVAWTVVSALTLTTHYYGVLAVVPQAVWLLWVHRRDPRVWLAVAVLAAVGLALLPLALTQSQTGNTAWIAQAPLNQRLGQIAPQFVIGTGAPARSWLKLAGALAVLLAAILLALRADAREQRGALLVGALASTGLLLSLVLILAGFDELITRNLIVVLIALIVLVAGGLGARRAGVLGLAGAAALCAIGLIATIAVAVDWELQRPDWGGVAQTLEANRPIGAASAILVENNDSLQPLVDYIPGLRVILSQGALVQEINVVAAVRAPSDNFCWWGAACSVPLAPLETSIQLPGFHPDGPVLHVNQFSIYRLRATSTIRLTRPEVARALAKTPLQSYALLAEPPA